MARKVKYMEIYHQIKEQILAGEYRVGDRLPTEKEFADQHDVSVHTVRQAMSLFSSEGVVQKIAGNGTFVQALPGETSGKKASAKNIGIIVWAQTQHMFPRLLYAVEDEIFSHGYHNVVCNTGKDPQREREIIERLIDQGIRGFIISPINWGEYCLESYRRILEQNIPLVMINRQSREIRTTSILVNNEEVGYMATRRLLEMGHRKIGHLTSASMWPEFTAGRIAGYRRALEEFGVPFDESLVVFSKIDDPVEGYDGARELLSRADEITGVFCVNDRHVLGLFEAACQLNISIPKELSVVGFDRNLEVHSRLPFRLDTFEYAAEQVGVCAAKELLGQIGHSSDYVIKTIELDPVPVVGNSCIKPSC
ncbi:MAG: GntR family transcriptional regulator [Kiritimatiellales bacterium]